MCLQLLHSVTGQAPHQNTTIVMCGIAKLFVGDVVETGVLSGQSCPPVSDLNNFPLDILQRSRSHEKRLQIEMLSIPFMCKPAMLGAARTNDAHTRPQPCECQDVSGGPSLAHMCCAKGM